MPRIKVQVPGGNFKSIQTGGSTVIQQVIQNRPTVAAPIPSFASGGGGGVTSITGTANEITASASTGDVTLSISSTYAGQASITTLGTIGTGVWEGTAIGVEYGGVPSTSGVDSGWVLTNQSGTPEWEAASGGSSPLTTKGDLYGYSSTDARIPIGTDGYILTADSSQTLGLKWAAATAAGTIETTFDQSGGTSQTYNVPAGTVWMQVICIGGGGGAGGGGKSTSATTGGGGGGGASGCMTIVNIDAADVGSSLTVAFSSTTGGAGGNGATVAGSGQNGTVGASVSVETTGGSILAFAGGGNPGTGGGNGNNGAAGASTSLGNVFNGLNGGAGSGGGGSALVAVSAFAATTYGPTGGGGGGPGTGTTGSVGGTGGSSPATHPSVIVTGGTGGTAGSGSVDGGAGGTGTQYSILAAAGGGGGGSASGAHTGGKGGSGSGYGAGGGGGGGVYDSTGGNGGAGGSGGYAACIIIAWMAATNTISAANPSASVGLSAVNGSATTFMRSDAAPALSQAIAPTWTGLHKFQPSGSNEAIHVYGATSQWSAIIDGKDTAGDSLGLLVRAGTNSSDYSFYVQDASGTYAYATARGDGLWSFYEPSFSAAALKKAATYDSGSFTGTLTACSGSPTGTIYWTRVGPVVTLRGAIIGTSSGDTLTMTGLPSALQPTATQIIPCVVIDDSVYTMAGAAEVDPSSGTIIFYISRTGIIGSEVAYESADFTTSGSKGFSAWSITYTLL